jgi:hypothetical protein
MQHEWRSLRRGKAPARACLPVIEWPEADRQRWLSACDASDLLNDAGARSGHARVSNAKVAKGYGRWLTHLSFVQPDALDEISADRVTPKRVQAYVNSLIEIGNRSQTILARLQELGEMAKVMDPNRDWSFVNRLASKVRARHRPARDKTNLRPSNELVDLGFKLIPIGREPRWA